MKKMLVVSVVVWGGSSAAYGFSMDRLRTAAQDPAQAQAMMDGSPARSGRAQAAPVAGIGFNIPVLRFGRPLRIDAPSLADPRVVNGGCDRALGCLATAVAAPVSLPLTGAWHGMETASGVHSILTSNIISSNVVSGLGGVWGLIAGAVAAVFTVFAALGHGAVEALRGRF